MNLGIEGRVAVVAASSDGLGKAVAAALCREGADVLINGRRADRLRAAAREMARIGKGRVHAVRSDVSTGAGASRLVREAVNRFGRLDILVTNAGGPPAGNFQSIAETTWKNSVDLTLMSVVRLVRAAIPYLKTNRWGRIVNMTSFTVPQPSAGMTLSSVLRAAVTNLTKTLADELAPHNVLVNAVAPGSFLTDRHRSLIRRWAEEQGLMESEIVKKMEATIPLGRIGDPAEFAEAVAFLCSEGASYVTGTTLIIDGGATRTI
jgi:3-oxoacyl-[acyl-carrier protein] reductase